MKKFYLCKLCLIVFSALLASPHGLAEEREVWYCTSTADVFILPDGDSEDFQRTEGSVRNWKLAISKAEIIVNEGPPNGIGKFKVLSTPEESFFKNYAAISTWGSTLMHFFPETGVMNISIHDSSIVNGLQFHCSKF